METEFVDGFEGPEEILFVGIVPWQLYNVLLVGTNESRRQSQEVSTYRVHRGGMVFSGQTDSFEPVDEVEGEEQQLEEGHIGGPFLSGDFSQGVVIKEFPVVFFGGGTQVVEEIGAPRTGFQIRHKNVIDIFPILEEFQLLGFLGIFRDRPPHDNEAVRGFPFVRLIEKLGGFPAVAQRTKFGFQHGLAQRTTLLGHDDIAASLFVEEFGDEPAVESRIHAKTNPTPSHLLRGLGQTDLQERNNSGRAARFASPQHSVPKLLQMRLETKQGMIGTTPSFFGIVANRRLLGFPVNSNDHRIDVESQTVPWLGNGEQIAAETVVKSNQLPNLLWCQTFEKTTQGRLLRKSFQPQHLQERPIVLQNVRPADTPQPHDDGVHQSQDQLGRMVAFVSAFDPNVILEPFLQTKLAAKTLN